MFRDRFEAAELLVKKLEKYRNTDGIILAVPRGGVPIGYIIAKELNLPLEIILSKKIGHPYNSEYAIGSVSLHGTVIDEQVNDVSLDYINKEANKILKSLKEKFALFMDGRRPADLKDKTVIIVDDGIATGNTIRVIIEEIKRSNPKEIIIAVPVAPPSTVNMLSKLVDELICLDIPEDFKGVGQFYYDFSQVEDKEVIQFLRDANQLKKTA